MSDDFDFLRDDDDDELPDWLTGSDDDEPFGSDSYSHQESGVAETVVAPSPYFEETVHEEPVDANADEFDLLRERTARNSEIYEDIDSLDGGANEGVGFFAALSGFQKLILAILVLANVIAFGFFVITAMNSLA
jgi:hypothetical protein